MVSGRHTELWSDAIGASGAVVAYGHYGRPVLAFPAERGNAWEYENRGMVDAVAELLDGGRMKLYCVESFDSASWSNSLAPARGARAASTVATSRGSSTRSCRGSTPTAAARRRSPRSASASAPTTR